VEENDVPSFLWRQVADEEALAELPAKERVGGETSAAQVFDRLAGTWAHWGWKGGYFDSEADASAYYDEMRHMLARQMAAPNSPQWFNTGLHWAYGIDGPAQGHHYVDFKTGQLVASTSAYEHPQPHACFIQSVADDLVNEGGIMDLWVREARLFKYGSGTGSNFSRLRGDGERLAGGGKSSGLMSFLKIGDRAAGAIKSGGTTRRAAKMVTVDLDHPDIEAYIDWKVVEEQKVCALVSGSKLANKHLNAIMAAATEGMGPDAERLDPTKNKALKRAIIDARKVMIPENYIQRVIQFAGQGYTEMEFQTYDTDWDSSAYLTVSGQNSNNSVRVSDTFIRAVKEDADWNLIRRTDGKVAKTLKARDLWDKIGHAAWQSADPGVQYDRVRPHQRVQPLLGIHVPGRHGLQPGVPEPDGVSPRRRLVRHRRLPPRLPAVDGGAGNLRPHGAVPLQGDRAPVLRVPHPGPGLRQHRRPADGRGHSVRQRRGPGHLRRHQRHHDRRRLRHLRRDGGRAGHLPGLCPQRHRHAARHPQPPPRRLRRWRGV
jgi:ribonucleoside-diphosphate reductase alpha chain